MKKPTDYPDWCKIDPYDDLGARTSKKQLQSLYDRNPECSQCKNDFRDHVTEQGTSKYRHIFMEKTYPKRDVMDKLEELIDIIKDRKHEMEQGTIVYHGEKWKYNLQKVKR